MTSDSVLGTWSCQRYTCTRFYSSFFTFFWHHSVKDKAEVQNFKNVVTSKLSVKTLYKIGFSQIPHYRQKRTVSFCVFSENVMFHSAYSPKTHNSASSLNTLFTAESGQFYSAFSSITISLTPRFCWKREVWLRFFAESAQNDPKTHSSEDNAIFNAVFLATTLSHASHFQRKRGVIENFRYLGEFVEYFQKCWPCCVLYLLVTERCKKKFKNRRWKSRACVPLSEVRVLVNLIIFFHIGCLNMIEERDFYFGEYLKQTLLT